MVKQKKISWTGLALFLLIFYFALLPLKDKLYPSQILVTISLLLAICLIIIDGRSIHIDHSKKVNIQYAWIAVGIIVLFYNNRLFSELVSGGVIQFLIMCMFIYFMKFKDNWYEKMYNIMLFFLVLHALATVVFAFSSSLYRVFIGIAYPDNISVLLKNYDMGRIAGLCSNYSTNGIYLSLGSGISFVYFLKSYQKKYCMLILLFAMALLISGKRGPLVFTLFSMIIVYWMYSNKKAGKSIKLLLGIFAIGLVVYIMAQYIPALNNTIVRFADLENNHTGGRNILYALAIQMFKESPLIGWGWGSYKYRANTSIIGSIYGTDSNMFAHNCYLQLLAEVGIIGFIVFIIAFLGTLILTIKLIKKYNKIGKKNEDIKSVLGISLFIQVFFLAYCMTGNPLYDYANQFPYMMSCALVVSVQYKLSLKNSVDVSNSSQ